MPTSYLKIACIGCSWTQAINTTNTEKIKEVDQNIRQNDMFGGLQNTVNSGTPIPLIYGMHRAAGQLISGYLDTVDHGKSDTITVASRFKS